MTEQHGILFKHDRDAREFFAGGAEVQLRDKTRKRIVIHPLLYVATGILATSAYNVAEQKLICTDLIRRYQEQDSIYLSHSSLAVREKFERAPWVSVHEVGRGIDFGVLYELKGGRALRNDNWTQAIVERGNEIMVYDPARPHMKCFVYKHASSIAGDPSNIGHGSHIHVQVHPNTRLLPGANIVRP